MERGNTKQEILEAALELFSVQGFEATSVSQIASAVGIRKASLYSHFENKQAILDELVKEVLEQYGAHSIFAKTDWGKDNDNLPLTPDDAVKMIGGQIRYLLHDPAISRARKCWLSSSSKILNLPISVWINLCDREPEREKEVMDLVDKHVR